MQTSPAANTTTPCVPRQPPVSTTPLGAPPTPFLTTPAPKLVKILTPAPRIGGVLPDEGPGEAWTGGSNIAPPTMPFHLTQRRPWKYASAKGLKDDISKGSTDKLGLNDEKSDCSFQLWLKQQHQAHVEFGLDSIFLMPSSDWSKETNIFFDHTLKPETIQLWTQQLLHGVHSTKNHVSIHRPPCPYDKQNLTFSRIFLLASVTPLFRQEIQNSVGLDATGIDVFL